MSKVLLDFNEIAGAIYNDYFSPDEDNCTVYDLEKDDKAKGYQRVCHAQLKAIIEYLEEPCEEHPHIWTSSPEPRLRKHCPECMKELKEEVK